jgi:hypothetical protein
MLSRSSVRRIVEQAGLAAPRQQKRPVQRYPQEGMLVQIDGSAMAGWRNNGKMSQNSVKRHETTSIS